VISNRRFGITSSTVKLLLKQLDPYRWVRFVVPKRRFQTTFRRVITQKKEEFIKVDLREVGWAGLNWIDLAEDRNRWRAVVNAVMNVRVTENMGNFLSS
jgi:hypothetical protein